MKKIVLMLAAGILFAWQGLGLAATSGVDSLIQKLEDKGILTSQEAQQIKGEITSDEKNSQEKTFKTMLPDWVSGLKISGDFRLRDQIQVRKAPGGSASGNNFDQNRARIRARLNFEDQINDKVKLVVGIATDGESNRSNNLTLGGNGKTDGLTNTTTDTFGKADVVLNKAYAVYTPASWATLMGGKMDNPIWEPGPGGAGSSFFWDPNITPEGGSIQLQKKLNEYITPWIQGDVFDLHAATPTAALKTDPYMLVTQGGLKGDLTEHIYYKGAVTWYDISNPSHLSFGEGLGINSGTTSGGGGRLTYNFNDVIVGSADMGINDPFGEMLPSPIFIPQIGIFGDYADNTSNSKDVPVNTGRNRQNKAWMAGAYMGNSSLNGWGTWKLASYYKVLGRDAWLDVLPDADFYSGQTNVKGWRSELDIGLMKNLWFTMAWFHSNIYKIDPGIQGVSANGTNTSPSVKAPENLFQMDLNFKF